MKRSIPARFLPRLARPRKKGAQRGPNFKAKTMTQPEQDFRVRVLSAMAASGVIDNVRFQAFTFEAGQGSKYTPDFTARRRSDNAPLAYEIKGPHVYEDSIIKFKGCVLLYPDWIWFWCQQDDAGEWKIARATPELDPAQEPKRSRGPYTRRRPRDPAASEGGRGET